MGLHRSRRNQAARVVADLLLIIGSLILLGFVLWLASIAFSAR